MSQLILAKQTSAPGTPSADKVAVYLDSGEVLAYVGDTGVSRNITPWVQAASFTPGISFGGGITGITYLTQFGRYQRIGGLLYFSLFVALTSKGSSTGVALVTGLPIASVNTTNYNHAMNCRYDAMSSISGMAMGFILPNVSYVRLEHLGTGTATQLTDANFTNSSSVMVTGFYET